MASGILGKASPTADTDTIIYTVPDSVLAVCNISVCNTGMNTASVRIALAAGDTPMDGEYIEYDTPVPARGSMERTGIALQAGRRVIVRASAAVNIVVYGMED